MRWNEILNKRINEKEGFEDQPLINDASTTSDVNMKQAAVSANQLGSMLDDEFYAPEHYDLKGHNYGIEKDDPNLECSPEWVNNPDKDGVPEENQDADPEKMRKNIRPTAPHMPGDKNNLDMYKGKGNPLKTTVGYDTTKDLGDISVSEQMRNWMERL